MLSKAEKHLLFLEIIDKIKEKNKRGTEADTREVVLEVVDDNETMIDSVNIFHAYGMVSYILQHHNYYLNPRSRGKSIIKCIGEKQ